MTISLGRAILRPSSTREPAFDSEDERASGYAFPCVSCESDMTLDLAALLQRAGDERVFGMDMAERIREHFDFNLVGKAHDGGWPRIAVDACGRCGAKYLIYLGVREPSNGWYRVTVQGITAIEDPHVG